MQKLMEYAGKALTALKDAYFWLVDWIDENPQKALWIGALIVAAVAVL